MSWVVAADAMAAEAWVSQVVNPFALILQPRGADAKMVLAGPLVRRANRNPVEPSQSLASDRELQRGLLGRIGARVT